jgi:hypothetical protein
MARRTLRPARFVPALALAVMLIITAGPADAAGSVVLTKGGTLYEVYPATYGQIAGEAAGIDADLPVLALRTTPSGGKATVQVVEGTLDADVDASEAIEFDEDTQSLFIAYTKQQNLYAGLRIALLANGLWTERPLRPTPVYALSAHARLVLTRQTYLDPSSEDPDVFVAKTRSILSVIWWEDGLLSQAKYAPLFIEDGVLNLDAINVYNLNELAGDAGSTSVAGLSPASFSFPAIQRSGAGDGSVVLSFANLATQKQTVLSLNFASAPPPGPGTAGPVRYSRHQPLGVKLQDGEIPKGGDIAMANSVGTIISPSGNPTFYWVEGAKKVKAVRGNAKPDAPPIVIPIRSDFSVDKAIAVVREMAEKE